MTTADPGDFVASLRRELVLHCDATGTADAVAERLIPGASGKPLTSLALPGTEAKISALLARAAEATARTARSSGSATPASDAPLRRVDRRHRAPGRRRLRGRTPRSARSLPS